MNQASGARFEARIIHACIRDDILCIQNGLRAKYVRGRLQAMPTSLLDWTLVSPDGRVVFADSKSFTAKRFGRSQLTGHQIAQAAKFAEHNVAAGFVVHLAGDSFGHGVVNWFPVQTILAGGARAGWGEQDGVSLGILSDFSLQAIFGDER